MKPADHLKEFLLESIEAESKDPAGETARAFRISRQAVNRHLRTLVREGKLKASGSTRGRKYAVNERCVTAKFTLADGVSEDTIWKTFVKPHLARVALPTNVLEICHHGLTEMVNNVIDHSGGTWVYVAACIRPGTINLRVIDNGVGIFRKIRDAFGLEDEQHAVLELAKGKLTTDPDRHSGEGIFFTSRMFDEFLVLSGCEFFTHDSREGAERPDFVVDLHEAQEEGTVVTMRIAEQSRRTTREVFDRFASPTDHSFSITHVPVSLARSGAENLISRSQSKRLTARFDRFQEVVLDFAGVNQVGQAFADETFRVFVGEHPQVRLAWANASDEVQKMISRVLKRPIESTGRGGSVEATELGDRTEMAT